MTVFNAGPEAQTMDFHGRRYRPVKANYGHYIQNVGDTDRAFLHIFKADTYRNISLSDRLTHT